jgi:hypothetical protein
VRFIFNPKIWKSLSEPATLFPLPPFKFRKFAAKEFCHIDERERILANCIPLVMMLKIAARQ